MKKDKLCREFNAGLMVALYLVRYPDRAGWARAGVVRAAVDLYFNEPLFQKQVDEVYQEALEFAEKIGGDCD